MIVSLHYFIEFKGEYSLMHVINSSPIQSCDYTIIPDNVVWE